MTCHLALGFTGSASHVTTGRSPCTPGVPEVSRDSNSVPPLVWQALCPWILVTVIRIRMAGEIELTFRSDYCFRMQKNLSWFPVCSFSSHFLQHEWMHLMGMEAICSQRRGKNELPLMPGLSCNWQLEARWAEHSCGSVNAFRPLPRGCRL